MTTPSYEALSRTLTEALALALPPIAVALTDEVPAGVPAHGGHAPAGCAFWQEAAAGAFSTSPGDHALCGVGMYTHNLARTPAEDAELGAALGVFAELGYVRAEDVPRIPVLADRRKHVVYAPLARRGAALRQAGPAAHPRRGHGVGRRRPRARHGAPRLRHRPAGAQHRRRRAQPRLLRRARLRRRARRRHRPLRPARRAPRGVRGPHRRAGQGQPDALALPPDPPQGRRRRRPPHDRGVALAPRRVAGR